MSSKSDDNNRRRKRIGDDDVDMSGGAATEEIGEVNHDEEESSRATKKRKGDEGANIDDVLEKSDDEAEEDEEEDEEDEDDDDDEEEDDDEEMEPPKFDNYDKEFIGDSSDRAYIESLDELQRESIILERREERERKIEEWRAIRATRAGRTTKKKKKKSKDKKSKSKKSKSSASAASSKPKRSEKRTAREAMADLLARKTHTATSKASSTKTFDEDQEEGDEEEDDMEDDESDGEARKRKRKSRARNDDYDDEEDARDVADAGDDEEDDSNRTHTAVQYANIKSIQLRRLALERVIDEPYFADVVQNMFVRVNVGNKDNGTPTYRACQIVGVEEWDKPKYKFGIPPKDIKIALKLKLGRAERLWSCALISNQSITPEEFEKWKAQCIADGVPILSAEDTLRLKRRAQSIRQNFNYSPEVLAKLLEQRRAAGKNITKATNLTAEKARLKHELAAARDKGEADMVRKYQQQLDECEEAERTLQAKLSQSQHSKSVQEILAINQRNIQENTVKMEEMMKMLREEKRRAAEEAKKLVAAGEAPVKPTRDAFKRKETRPTMEFVADEEQAARAKAAKEEAEKKKKEEEMKKEDADRLAALKAAKKNKLESFDDIMTSTTDEDAMEFNHAAAIARVDGARTLHLPSQPTTGEKLHTLLQKVHRRVSLSNIDENASHPTTTLASVLGRVLSNQGGFVAQGRNDEVEVMRWMQRPQGHVLTLEEYAQQRRR